MQQRMDKRDLPATSSINEIKASKGGAEIDDGVDDGHGERVDSSDISNEDGAVCRGKSLASSLLEEVHSHHNRSTLQILSLEKFEVVALLRFVLQGVLKSSKALVDLGFGLFALS